MRILRGSIAIAAVAATGALASARAGPMDKAPVEVGHQIYSAQNADRDWSLNLKGDPPCAFRFELRPSDQWIQESPKQPEPVERSELQGPTDSTDPAAFDAPVWTAYQFKIAPGVPSAARWVVLGDWHVRPDPGDTAILSSPWQLELLAGDILAFETIGSTEKPVKNTTPVNYLWKSPAPIVRGVWHSLASVVYFDWRPGGKGAVTVWLDGTRIVDYKGPFGYNTGRPPYFKFGIYRSKSPETLVVDYANVETSRASLAWRIAAPPPICGVRPK